MESSLTYDRTDENSNVPVVVVALVVSRYKAYNKKSNAILFIHTKIVLVRGVRVDFLVDSDSG